MGQYVTGGLFDLILSFRHSPSEAHLDRWKRAFQKASELLFAATDGQQQLRNIWVCTDSAGGLNADFWVFGTPIPSSANARIWEPHLHGELGHHTRYIPFTIVHELGHYLYALGDEYKTTGGEEARCIGSSAEHPPSACIMEAGEGRGDKWDTSGTAPVWVEGEVHQFCTADNHDKGPPGGGFDDEEGDTVQSDRHEEACWETMHRFYPDLAVPTELGAHRKVGADEINWIPLVDEKRYVFIADLTSIDPLGPTRPIRKLEEILHGLVRTAPRHEFFGAVITDGDTTYVGDLSPALRRGGWPATPGNPLSQLEPGPRKDLSEMFRAAGRMIVGAGDPAATQVVAFASFGPVDTGPHPFAAAGALRDRGIRLYTFGADPCPQQSLLNSLAAVTGGTFARFSLTGRGPRAALRTRLAELYDLTHEEGGLVTVDAAIVDTSNASLAGASSEGDGDEEPGPAPVLHEFESPIEDGCARAVFTLEWLARAPFELVLRSPSGDEFAEAPEDTGYRDPEDRFRLIEVERPEAGNWRARVVLRRGAKRGVVPPVKVLHRVHVGPSRVKFALSTPQPAYALGETVRVMGQVAAERVLSGVRMRGTVTGPDGRASEIELTEPPAGKWGGRVERTGYHLAEFTPREEGPHEIRVVADNMREKASMADGGDNSSNERESVPPPGAFVRHASMTVLVGDPPAPSGRAEPHRVARGEMNRVKVRFTRIPWVPGVSRLSLGAGIEVHEDLKSAAAAGDPVFQIHVGVQAELGVRGAVVITGGKRHWIPRLIRVSE